MIGFLLEIGEGLGIISSLFDSFSIFVGVKEKLDSLSLKEGLICLFPEPREKLVSTASVFPSSSLFSGVLEPIAPNLEGRINTLGTLDEVVGTCCSLDLPFLLFFFFPP